MSVERKNQAAEGGEDVFVFSGVVVNCSGCGAEVELSESELVDGQPPKTYNCAICD
jgi:hypothetical protein